VAVDAPGHEQHRQEGEVSHRVDVDPIHGRNIELRQQRDDEHGDHQVAQLQANDRVGLGAHRFDEQDDAVYQHDEAVCAEQLEDDPALRDVSPLVFPESIDVLVRERGQRNHRAERKGRDDDRAIAIPGHGVKELDADERNEHVRAVHHALDRHDESRVSLEQVMGDEDDGEERPPEAEEGEGDGIALALALREREDGE